jgi:hypothetical protein
MTGHKYTKGQQAKVASGNVYQITKLRTDDHRKFKGQPGYEAIQIKNGQPYGPIWIFPEGSLRAA